MPRTTSGDAYLETEHSPVICTMRAHMLLRTHTRQEVGGLAAWGGMAALEPGVVVQVGRWSRHEINMRCSETRDPAHRWPFEGPSAQVASATPTERS